MREFSKAVRFPRIPRVTLGVFRWSGGNIRRSNQPRRLGFTLVEMLVATTLAVTLMVALVGILKGLKEHRELLDQRRMPEGWKRSLRDQIFWDLQNARRMTASQSNLRIRGFSGRHFSTGNPHFRPTRVVYAIEKVNEMVWLTRTETQQNSLFNQNSKMDLICVGVKTIELRWQDWNRQYINATLSPAEENRVGLATEHTTTIPRWLEMQMLGENSEVIFSETFRL